MASIRVRVERTETSADGTCVSSVAMFSVPLLARKLLQTALKGQEAGSVAAASSSAVASTSASASDGPASDPHGGVAKGSYLVGTLNLLGALESPVEFLPLHDDQFMAAYQRLETCARKLTLETVQRYLKMMHIEDEKILNRFKEFEAHGSQTPGNEVWSFFQEDQLSNDNKLVDNRLNLITKAMAALTALPARLKSTWRKGKSLQWHLLREQSPGANPKQKWMAAGPTEWTAAMSELCNDATYTKDQDLFLFDFCCNIVANETTETLINICDHSIQNPINIGKNANMLFGYLQKQQEQQNKPFVLGMQEWPDEGTAHNTTYQKLLKESNCTVVVGTDYGAISVAITYSASLGGYTVLSGPTKAVDPVEIMKQCIVEHEDELSAKDKDSLGRTTAGKTLAVRIGDKLSVIVVHAKEPKSKGATKTLAAYAAKMVAAVPQPAVLTIDSNCSSAESAQLFGSEIVTSSPTQSMSCVPDAKDGAVSTSKHRGLIHGQTYDQRKVLKTVSSLKDRIVGSKDGVMGNGAIHPDLGGMKTLPASDWPSDHALVWSTYTVG